MMGSLTSVQIDPKEIFIFCELCDCLETLEKKFKEKFGKNIPVDRLQQLKSMVNDAVSI